MKQNGARRSTLKHSPDEKKPETIDGQTGKPDDTPATERRIDLSNLRDVRLELAAVYRKMDSGAIPSQDGTRRAYVLKTIADVLALAELEQRLIALEEQQGVTPGSRPSLPARALN
jgi:hypothetical protein